MTRLAHGTTGLVLLVLLSMVSSAGAHPALEDPHDSGRPLAERMKFDRRDSGLLTEGAATTARPEPRFAVLEAAGSGGGGGAVPAPIRPPNADTVISQPSYADTVISEPGTSYYVDGDLVLHYVPDGDTHNCLIRTKTVIDRSSVSDAQFNAFTRGPNATCSQPEPADLGQFADKVISQPGIGYYVDGDLVLHYVPDGDTYNCLIRTKTVIDRGGVSDAQFNAFTRGPNATCGEVSP